MKFIILLLGFLCLIEAKSQISIYDCVLYQGTPAITQQMIDDAGYEFNKPCMILDNTFNFNGSTNKALTSINSIDILPDFETGNYDATYGMDIKIQPKADFDMAVMNYSNLNEVMKLKKFELGVELPASILEKVNNFVTEANVGEKINPYLEEEIRVVAEFTGSISTQWFSQPYTYLLNISIDGFYAKDFTSEMFSSEPTPANSIYFEDEEYWNLGKWTEVPTDYPFRIRFAPPENGDWECLIKIYVGSDVYESNVFNFKVIESGSDGYIKAGNNGRFLALGGKTFIPIGCNISWPETTEAFDPELSQYMKTMYNGTLSPRAENYRQYYVVPRVYEKYKGVMNNLIDNGANNFRTIMYPTGTEIEWEKLGNYTKRLHMAQEMDKILELAEERNAYIHWNLQIHYSFQNAAAAYGCAWTWNYQTVDGETFCYRNLIGNNDPVSFFTHEDSKKFYKQRLRYILARYGYSTNISVFELFSEISNVGSTIADNSDYYKTGDNYLVYEDWQREMAAYIKTQHNGSIHLVTSSYAGAKVIADKTFQSPNMGLSTSNIYNFNTPEFSNSFWNNEVAEKYLNDDCSDDDIDYQGYNEPCGDSFNPKPLMFSETGPVDVECTGNYIETNRNMWEGLFSGLAGTFSWNNWYEPANYAIYGQMKNFVAGIDFDGGQWHPGASKRDDLPKWIYKGAFAEDMESQVVDLAYLRSGDGNFAIGVLTNKTFNSRNFPNFVKSCVNPVEWPIPSDTSEFPNFQSIVNADWLEGVRLRDLKPDNYYINYFLPTDLSTPIHSSDGNNGPQIPLQINIAPTEQTYIILFMARREGHDWADILKVAQTNMPQEAKELNNSSVITGNQALAVMRKKVGEITIAAYPVPTLDDLIVNIQHYNGIIDYTIESIDGKLIKYSQLKHDEKVIELSNIERGTYTLKFIINGNIIKTQKIVKI
jgi:hypothetical protein